MQDVKIEGFQLSPQQRHLWKLTQEQVNDSPYLAHCVVRIRGLADVAVLTAVLEALPARHEILRTMFYAPEEVSTPFQVIAPVEAATTPVEYQDLSALDANRQRSAIGALRDRMSEVLALNPTSPALIGLASLSTSEHMLVIGVPGLRCDLAGLKNLVADIARGYEARVQAADLPDEGLQYPDASAWLNDTLDSPESAVGRRFWESQDLSRLLTNRLPFEPEGEAPFAPRRVPIRLAPESIAAVRLFAASPGISPELVLVTCWQCLLQRTMGIETIAVGCMADGRSYAELESAVGLFARCLPLSGDLSNDVRFVDAIHQLASAIRDAKQWGECFDWRLIPQDRTGRTPSLPLVFEHQDWRAPHLVQHVAFEIEEAWACVDRFKLKLCSSGSPEDFGDVWLEYDSGVFREADVTRLASQFETLFATAAANPQIPLGQLRLLPASQEVEIVTQFGRAPHTAPSAALVHQLFERHAAVTPEKIAVVCEEKALTYAELNGRSNQLAHYLRTVGVGPDVLVGLCVERSVDVAVGILGILKAGGAYVPLDPHLPPARLAVMLEESGAAVVVSRTSLAGLLPSAVRLVLLDGARELLDAFPTTNGTREIGPANLAYVLFTSGSTGKPKGVAIEHQQLASYVDAVSARLDVPPGAAFATVTTYAADLGNTAIYPALTSGGCLHILTEERAADPSAFADYAERHAIDVLKIVPSHLRALLSGARPMRVLPRQRLVLGGEACPWDLVDEVRRLAPACLVFNHYGPTETTVGATAYRVPDNGARPPAATVPIGAPLDHAQAYALDRHLQIVPLWVTGELHIGGAGVARGYLADAALTQEKFIPDPRGTHPGARMYKTGDRVRMLPGGVIEFLGRIDNQVKIRGFRVELGEVEASLRRHPSVKDAAILAHDDGTGTRLSAFLVHRDGPRPTAADLRTFLQKQGLPDYMIPTSLVGLEALPLTSNGKVDRQRLPALLELPASQGAENEGLTEWESIVAEIWQELLGVDQVQTRDNFYDLGGHSLMAIQVVTALERRARVQISPRDLVFHTLKQFAALCASKSVPNADAPSSQA